MRRRRAPLRPDLVRPLLLAPAWALVAVGRFALLRAWVFAAPPAEETGRSIVTRT